MKWDVHRQAHGSFVSAHVHHFGIACCRATWKRSFQNIMVVSIRTASCASDCNTRAPYEGAGCGGILCKGSGRCKECHHNQHLHRERCRKYKLKKKLSMTLAKFGLSQETSDKFRRLTSSTGRTSSRHQTFTSSTGIHKIKEVLFWRFHQKLIFLAPTGEKLIELLGLPGRLKLPHVLSCKDCWLETHLLVVHHGIQARTNRTSNHPAAASRKKESEGAYGRFVTVPTRWRFRGLRLVVCNKHIRCLKNLWTLRHCSLGVERFTFSTKYIALEDEDQNIPALSSMGASLWSMVLKMNISTLP